MREYRAENVKLIGRTQEEGGILWLALSGSGLEFVFHGRKAQLVITGDGATSGEPVSYARYAVYVDGVRTVDDMLGEPERVVELFSSEESRDVTITFLKLSEAENSSIGIRSIQTDDDALIQPAPARELKLEFIGDSITCGYGVDDEVPEHSFSTATEDATRAWAWKAARMLDADYSLVSYSGHGIVSGYTDNGEREVTMLVPPVYRQFAKTYGSSKGYYSEERPWDFTRFVPDIVVINLGTNDDSYTGDDPERAQEYIGGYVSFLKVVRECNPGAHIVCALGAMGDRLYPAMEEAVRRFRETTGEEHISTCHLTPQDGSTGYVADFHPTERTHERAARELVEHMYRHVSCVFRMS